MLGRPVMMGAQPVPTTWNPSDKSGLYTLSNGNLTATHDGSSTSAAVRGTPGRAQGKRYIEFTLVSVNTMQLGFADASHALTSELTVTTHAVGYASSDGKITQNSSVLLTAATAAQNDVLGVAIDMDAHLLWVRVNGGDWNNSGSADPAAGTGGASILSGTLYPALSNNGNNSVAATINDGLAAFTRAPPAGFSRFGAA
jgi:hypothetical protein